MRPTVDPYSDRQAAQALTEVVGKSRWDAVAFAYGYLRMLDGAEEETAARRMYEVGGCTLKRSRQLIE